MAPDPFAPAQLGPITLRNRVIKAATFEGVTPDALVTRELIDYHLAPARGGVGMTTVAYLAVAPDGRTHKECIWVREEALRGLAQLADEVHEAGAAISGQIGHAGLVANPKSNGEPSIAPSKAFSAIALRRIRAASEADLARVRSAYARSAALLAQAGFDAIEIHLGHNYLLSSFLAPGLNKRTDQYGGSLENRARYPRSVVEAVKDAVGDTMAVTAKLNMVDAIPGGIKIDESLAYARMLEADGCLDALELTGGSSYGNPMFLFRGDVPLDEFAETQPLHIRLALKVAGSKLMKGYPFEEAFFAASAAQFKAALDLPIILLGGINRLDTITQAMADGYEFVAMGRALLHQSDLVNEMSAGRQDAGACTHCNRCMPSIYSGTRCVLEDPSPIRGGDPIT
ncbi:MAG TPA: NADH:flavin oxidoreductase [Acidimicrobiales bacterium]|nr:NADH:flavin oxidoreductase [Acidimicrobiales bacterium]